MVKRSKYQIKQEFLSTLYFQYFLLTCELFSVLLHSVAMLSFVKLKYELILGRCKTGYIEYLALF